MDDWTHAFDGLVVEGSNDSMDLGEFLRTEPLDPISEAVFRACSERIMELSKAAIEAGSGWVAAPDTPTDTGIATPDVQFVAVPIPVDGDGRIQCVYGPFVEASDAIQVAQGLSSDPNECYAVPVVAWES